jgi:RNA polymerase sigma-70 factor (ECF subfamily)
VTTCKRHPGHQLIDSRNQKQEVLSGHSCCDTAPHSDTTAHPTNEDQPVESRTGKRDVLSEPPYNNPPTCRDTIVQSTPEGHSVEAHNGNLNVPSRPSDGRKPKSDANAPSANSARITLLLTSHMDLQTASNQKLLEYCLRTDDQLAWMEFKRRLKSLIRGVIARRLDYGSDRSPESIDDLEQDVYVKLFANDCRVLRKFQWPTDESIFSYVTATARSVVEDHRRKRKNDPLNRGESLDDPDRNVPSKDRGNSDCRILRGQIDKCLRISFGSEPEFKRDRAMFWLYYRWGYTAKQIACIPSIGLPVKKVENILQRLGRAVKSMLESDSRK